MPLCSRLWKKLSIPSIGAIGHSDYRLEKMNRIKQLAIFTILSLFFVTPVSANILISDSGNHRVIEVDANKNIVWQFGVSGEPGSDNRHLSFPGKAVRLNDSRTMIVDIENRRILVVDQSGHVEIVVSPHISCEFYPTDAAVFGSDLWIADGHGQRLLCENKGRVDTVLDNIKGASGSDAYFGLISSIEIMDDSTIIAVDKQRSRIVGLDMNGQRVWQYGINDIAWGDGLTLNHPQSVTIDADSLYVADTDNSRICRWRIGSVRAEIILGGSRGCAPGQLNEPTSVDLIGKSLLVCEKLNHRVTIYGSDGQANWRYGDNYQPGSKSGLLKEPSFAQYVPDDLEYGSIETHESASTTRHPVIPMPLWVIIVISSLLIVSYPAWRKPGSGTE